MMEKAGGRKRTRIGERARRTLLEHLSKRVDAVNHDQACVIWSQQWRSFPLPLQVVVCQAAADMTALSLWHDKLRLGIDCGCKIGLERETLLAMKNGAIGRAVERSASIHM